MSLSGDIEENPGPNFKRKSNSTHILLFISIIITIITFEQKQNFAYHSKTPKIFPKFPLFQFNFNRNYKKFNTSKFNNSKYLFLLLIILSNDVQLNPGPETQNLGSPIKQSTSNLCLGNVKKKKFKLANNASSPDIPPKNRPERNRPVKNICSTCNNKTHTTNRLTCSTCKKQFHKACIFNQNLKPNSQIQWICTERNCAPNWYKSSQKALQTENRFSVLKHNELNDNQESIVTPQETHQRNKSDPVDEILLNELPRISHEDYVGKPLCNICNIYIRKNAKPLICTVCDKNTHLKCAKTIYSKFKTDETKRWVCSKCKTSEKLITTTFNKSACLQNDMPEEWKQILSNKPKETDIIVHFNCRSLVRKKEEFIYLINKIQPAIAFLSETWFDDSCPKGMAVPNNYTIIRKDRSENFKHKYGKKNGGGVAILIRKGVKLKTAKNPHIADEDEILSCHLITKTKKYSIIFMYRAEYTDLLKQEKDGNSKMESILQNTDGNDLIIIGDMNCDVRAKKPSKDTQQLITLCEDYKLKQLINKPTRMTTTSSTTIDHLWTGNNDLITTTGTCEGISDHCGIYAYVNENLGKQEPEEITYRDFRNFSEEKYKEDIKKYIQESDFNLHLKNKDINKALDTWLTSIKQSADKNAPMITKTKKNGPQIPWYNKELEEVTKLKNMYIKLYKLYKNPEDKLAIKIAKNQQTHLKRKYKREYYKERINNFTGNSKKMWDILHDITDKSYKEDILPDIVNDECANKFNNYFANVGINVQKKLKINIPRPVFNEKGQFEFQPESKIRIEHLINRIKPNVAIGHDQISAKLIKIATPVISEDLTKLVNLSYETRTFPDQLKIAVVKPIHKKGCNNDPAQYRPISILPVVSKIFERSAVDQLMKYAVENNLINSNQHAYQKHHSTVTCLFELVESIKTHMDQGNMVAMAALDLSKAFDSLAHNLILQKLNNLGLAEKSTLWIESYLNNRKQSVKLGQIISNQETVESGVPQGSILGPLLFIITTNDISQALEEYEVSIYADDMQILVHGSNINEMQVKLEAAIKKANNYYNENSLLCNPTKTEIILFGTEHQIAKQNKLQITVRNETETKVLTGDKHIKILGVYLDQHLNWNKHISFVKQKATNSIRMLHRINHCLPRKQQRILYNSLVVPHFSYADIIWTNCGRKNIQKLQLAQNFAAKSMLGKSKRSSASSALKTLELIPLEQKRQIHLAVHVKKTLVGNTTENIQKMYLNQLSRDNSRSAIRGDLTYPKHRSKQYSDGTFYTSLKIWNSIPLHLRDNNLNNFKTELQKHYTKQYLES